MGRITVLLGSLVVIFGFWFSTALAQATDVDCDGCVDTTDLADGAVRGRNIANGHILSKHIKNGNLITQKFADGAVTGDKIAASAVGVTQVDPAQVQLRVGGSCSAGSFITAIAEDGSVSCAGGYAKEDNDEFRHIIENDADLLLDRTMTCGEYRLYGCTQSTSANGTVFQRGYYFGGVYNMAFYSDPGIGGFLALPINMAAGGVNQYFWDEFDHANLWLGGGANILFVYPKGRKPVLVDDCDNPTIALRPSGFSGRPSLSINNGNLYRAVDGSIVNTVDVTGQSYGRINPQYPGEIVEACTMVTDQEGLWDAYELTLVGSLADARFAGPWTHQSAPPPAPPE